MSECLVSILGPSELAESVHKAISDEYQIVHFQTLAAFTSWLAPSSATIIITKPVFSGRLAEELLREFRARSCVQPVIILDECGSVRSALAMMKAGAFDYVTACESVRFRDAVAQASAQLTGDFPGEHLRAALVKMRLSRLSNRERQVLERVCAGNTNKNIARDLSLSPRTVEIYRAKLMSKMAADSIAELVKSVLLAGAVQPERSGRIPASFEPERLSENAENRFAIGV